MFEIRAEPITAASRLRRPVQLAAVVAALLIAGLLLAAALLRIWWSEGSRIYERSIEEQARVERCPVVEGAKARIHLGGWAEVDWCEYTYPDGTTASPDHRLASQESDRP